MERMDAVHAVAELSCHGLPKLLRTQRQTVYACRTASHANFHRVPSRKHSLTCWIRPSLGQAGFCGQKHYKHLYSSLLTMLQCFGHGLRDGSVTAPPVLMLTQKPVGIREPAGPHSRSIGVLSTELLYPLPPRDQVLLLGRGLRISQD